MEMCPTKQQNVSSSLTTVREMDKQKGHEMVGSMLDSMREAADQDKEVEKIVMLGEGYAALLADISATQLLVNAGHGYEFCGIPVFSGRAEGESLFRLEYK